MSEKPIIAITMGDPAGIGPEIIAKAMDSGGLFPICRPVIIGDAGVMKKVIEEMRISLSVLSIASPKEAEPRQGREKLAYSLDLLFCPELAMLIKDSLRPIGKDPVSSTARFAREALQLCHFFIG